jgi:hypothetical protein
MTRIPAVNSRWRRPKISWCQPCVASFRKLEQTTIARFCNRVAGERRPCKPPQSIHKAKIVRIGLTEKPVTGQLKGEEDKRGRRLYLDHLGFTISTSTPSQN